VEQTLKNVSIGIVRDKVHIIILFILQANHFGLFLFDVCLAILDGDPSLKIKMAAKIHNDRQDGRQNPVF
jgi:hypothetical protein